MSKFHQQHEPLIRQALREAIIMAETTIDGNLPNRPEWDTPREMRLRAAWKDRARKWKRLLKDMGGKRPGEFTIDEEIQR